MSSEKLFACLHLNYFGNILLIGQRIARSFFTLPDADGTAIQRATIVGLQDIGTTIDDDWYFVLYDDGQAEDLQVS